MNKAHEEVGVRSTPWVWFGTLAAMWGVGFVGTAFGSSVFGPFFLVTAAIVTFLRRYATFPAKGEQVSLNKDGLFLGKKFMPWRTISRIDIRADAQHASLVRGPLGETRHDLNFETAEANEQFARAVRQNGIAGSVFASGFARWVRVPVTGVILVALFVLRSMIGHAMRPGFWASAASPLTAALFVVLLACALGRTSLEIGADGVQLNEWMRSRFIPFNDISSVSSVKDALRITTMSGEVIRFSAVSALKWKGQDALALSLSENVLRAKQRFDATSDPLPTDLLAPHELTDQWKERVKGNAEHYRSGSETDDRLRDVLGHPAALPTARVAAAVKLAKEGGDDAKARIRIAAAETASPKLRIALEKAANGEIDAALDEAIEAERAT